jgi:DnaJ domain
MNPNSSIFDKIRIAKRKAPVVAPEHAPCAHAGCQKPGLHRAPMGRDREGQYFSFCIDHVRQYNAAYNFFSGMSEEAVAEFQKAALTGHRPTWTMGMNRAGGPVREDGVEPANTFQDLNGFATRRGRVRAAPRAPRLAQATLSALDRLGLDETADAPTVKARYKDLVKRLHPDANGGDRSSEDRLREIIRAYNYLRSVKLG